MNPHFRLFHSSKLKLQRKLNIIIYLSELMTDKMGGELGFWSDKNAKPHKLVKTVEPVFNRYNIRYNTELMAWNGLASKLPTGIYRKSIAVYYLCDLQKVSFT